MWSIKRPATERADEDEGAAGPDGALIAGFRAHGPSTGQPGWSKLATPSPRDSIIRLLPWLVAVAYFMEALDSTILNTAVPTIAGAMHVAPLGVKSALTSYTLSLAVFIPISGWVADRFGTRRVFSAAIGIFTLGSLLCGLSNSMHALVASRILQGCGGAMMVPVGRLTLVRTIPRSDLVRAMAFVSIPAMIAPLIGPLAGGLIVAYFHWRLIFFVNLPVGLLGLYLVCRYLPDYRADRFAPLDFIGLVLFGSSIALFSYVFEIFGEHTLGAPEIAGLLAIAVLLLLAYWRYSLTIDWPLLRLSLFRIRTFRISVVGAFVTRLGVGGMPFLLPLLYQVGLGYSPVQSGLLIIPKPLAAMCLKMTMPWVLARLGYRRVLPVNTIVFGLIIALFATIGPSTPAWMIVIQTFCFGYFSSLQYTSMNTLVYADLSDRDINMGITIASAIQQMSMSFGVAVASLTTGLFIGDRHHTSAPEMVAGIHKALVALGALTVVSALIFLGLRPGDGSSVSQHQAAPRPQPAEDNRTGWPPRHDPAVIE